MSAQQTARAVELPGAGQPLPAPGRPAPRHEPRPRLRLVRAPAQVRTRVPFVLLCMGVLAASLLTALLLNTQMAHGAYRQSALDGSLSQLDQEQMDLVARLDESSSPSQLARTAKDLGMVPAGGVGWLRLSDGTVSGAPKPAARPK